MKKITAIAVAFMAVFSYGSFAYAFTIYSVNGSSGTINAFISGTDLTSPNSPTGSCISSGVGCTALLYPYSGSPSYNIGYVPPGDISFYFGSVLGTTYTGSVDVDVCTVTASNFSAGATTNLAGECASGITVITFNVVGGNYVSNNITPPTPTNTKTHFISVSPINNSTTTVSYSVGSDVYASSTDFDPASGGRVLMTFSQDSNFACTNSGAVYDAIATCTGSSTPVQPFSIAFEGASERLISGLYNLSTTTTFGAIGAWTGVYQIQQVSSPWYLFGLSHSYNTLLSTTTHFIVSTSSAMDVARANIARVQAVIASTTAHAIASILASTTAQWGTSCQPFSSAFNMGDCLTLTFWPGDQALSDDFTIIKETPPWGYAFRFIDILNATTSSTTLPSISYTFATSNPLSADVGDVHFDPFLLIQQSGTLINEMKSDQAGNPTVWTILMPVVQIFVYLVLIFMIIHDITGVYNHGPHKSRGVNNDDEK